MWWEQAWGAVSTGASAVLAWLVADGGGGAQTVVLVATLLFTVVESRRNRRAAVAAASRADAAASTTIDALTRVAQGIEAVVARMPVEVRTTTSSLGVEVGASAQASIVRRAEWSLTHYDGDRYHLENVGTGKAWHVRVGVDRSILVGAGPLTTDDVDIPPREAQTFLATRTLGTRDSTVTVTWKASEDADEVEVWRYPLPPKR